MSTNNEETHRPLRRGLSVKDLKRATGLSHATTYRLIGAGKLRTIKVLGRRVIPEDELDRLLREGA